MTEPQQPVEHGIRVAAIRGVAELWVSRSCTPTRWMCAMTESSDFLRRLTDLHGSTRERQDALEEIVGLACESLHSEHGGIMLVSEDGSVESVAVTDELVSRADDLQRSLDEGPCLSAIEDDAHVELVARTLDDPRWPRWGPAADGIGIRSVVSVRLARSAGDPIGSLNVYNQTRDGFGEADIDLARQIGRHASTALIALGKLQALDRGLTARSLIGQAEGTLMMQYGIEAAEAFAMLRRHSDKHDVALDEVAQQVVDDGGLQTPPNAR